MIEEKKNSNKISVYLIKRDISYNKILKPYVYDYILDETNNGKTYYYPSKSNKPEWLIKYFKKDDISDINTENAKVISLIKLNFNFEERIFVIPFGNGKNLLNDDVLEEQFGIKVLLNSIEIDSFRQINMTNYAKNHKVATEQLPKKSSILDFGFSIDNDFMRKATAKSYEDIFGKYNITGGDLLNATVSYDKNNIEEYLKFLYEKYNSKKYKKYFEWIDNIKEVKSTKEKENLWNEAIKLINNREFDKIWLAIPDLINWNEIKGFKFSLSEKASIFDDIEIEDFISVLKDSNTISFEQIKQRKVFGFSNTDDEKIYESPIYKCLFGDFDFKGEAYCLNSGKWYKINQNFSKELINYYETIPLFDGNFSNNVFARESEYNKVLANTMDAYLMDCKLISSNSQGHSSIELCDILTKQNELIHIKNGKSSTSLSHLFNQAAVSGELLLENNFRNNVNSKIQEEFKINNFFNDFIPKNYKIILGIITNKIGDRPKIPFFSKITIRYTKNILEKFGYEVYLKNIYNEYKKEKDMK